MANGVDTAVVIHARFAAVYVGVGVDVGADADGEGGRVRVVREAVQVQLERAVHRGFGVGIRLAVLAHDADLRRAHVVREVRVGRRRTSQNLNETKLNKHQTQTPIVLYFIFIFLVAKFRGEKNFKIITRKARNPTRATECSTPTMTFSRTHLSMMWLETIMMTGPATNLHRSQWNSVN